MLWSQQATSSTAIDDAESGWTTSVRKCYRSHSSPAIQLITDLAVIVRNGQTAPTYEVSGLTKTSDPAQCFVVPGTKRSVWPSSRHDECAETIYAANFNSALHRDEDVYGFPVHAHCWTLVRRVISLAAERQLELFFRVLEKRWEANPFRFIPDEETSWLDWRNRADADFNPVLNRAIEPYLSPAKEFNLNAKLKRNISIRKRRNDQVKPVANPGPPPARLNGTSILLKILYGILHYLDIYEAHDLLEAIRWQIPDAYWRGQLMNNPLFFEVQKLTPRPAVNWRALCYRCESLAETDDGLINRRRILQILDGTAALFWAALASDDRDGLLALEELKIVNVTEKYWERLLLFYYY